MARVHMYKATIKDLKEASFPVATSSDIDYSIHENTSNDPPLIAPLSSHGLNDDTTIYSSNSSDNNNNHTTAVITTNITNTATLNTTNTTDTTLLTPTNTTMNTTTTTNNNDNTNNNTNDTNNNDNHTNADMQLNNNINIPPTTLKTMETDATMTNAESSTSTAFQPDSQPTTSTSRPETTDLMDQAAAATALQLLGLAQQQREDLDNLLQPPLEQKRGTWTREEDELLLKGIKKFGYGRWKEIANMIPGRKGKQLKQRWDNTLASKYVDQEWLKNKIKHDDSQWATLTQKITEKIKTDSLESVISQALLSIQNLPLKRKRSDPQLATTQSDAVNIFACATPIKVDNETQSVYPCLFPNCGKTFARLYNLKSHSRTHTDERPFVCSVCQIAFSRNHDLKRHTKIHGGDKPYSCQGCNKTFSRLDALKRHKANQRNKATCMN